MNSDRFFSLTASARATQQGDQIPKAFTYLARSVHSRFLSHQTFTFTPEHKELSYRTVTRVHRSILQMARVAPPLDAKRMANHLIAANRILVLTYGPDSKGDLLFHGSQKASMDACCGRFSRMASGASSAVRIVTRHNPIRS